jgi:hypothetical protein
MRPLAFAVRRLLAALRRPFAASRSSCKSAPDGKPASTAPAPKQEEFLLVLLRSLSAWGT